jgi:hypothetical protein
MAVMGLAARLTSSTWLNRFDLDAEGGPAAAVSAALLLAGAGTLAVALRHGRGFTPVTGALPAVLVLMSLDEWRSVHESVEGRTGVDWQALYAPLVLLAGLAWWKVLRCWGTRSANGQLLVLGAVAWALSQVLEFAEWTRDTDVPRTGYAAYMLVEEVLEAAGSSCFLLAGLIAVVVVPRSDAG